MKATERLGDYLIVREIGRGGMGIVYEAIQESLGRRVALKVLAGAAGGSDGEARRFEREARAAARLHHTNIVQVFGVGRHEGAPYYVMQFIEGQPLDRVINAVARRSAESGRSNPSLSASPVAVNEAGPSASRLAALLLLGEAGPEDVLTEPAETRGPVSPSHSPSTRPATAGAASQSTGTALSDTTGRHFGPAGAATPRPEGPAPSAATGARPSSDRTRSLPGAYWRSVARIGLQAAGALDHAHGMGVLHRDVKPSNFLIDGSGAVWVTDFGLAKVAEQDDLTRPGDVLGTLRYMAPEQLDGKSDARSDVYGLGLTLYEMAALRPAFDETQATKLGLQVMSVEPPPPSRFQRGMPGDLDTIIRKAIAKSPGDRYGSAADLAADLHSFLEDRPISARRLSQSERFLRWCRRNRAVAVLSGTAAALLIVVAVVSTVGFIETRRSLRRAEATLDISLDGFEQVFRRLAPYRGPVIASAGSQESEEDPADEGEADSPLHQPAVSRETAALLESMLVFYDRFAALGSNDPRIRLAAAKANRRVGDIRQRLGDYQRAEAAYREAIVKFMELAAASPRDVGLRIEIARLRNEIGSVDRAAGLLTEAVHSHRQALTRLETLARRGRSSADVEYETARSHFFLATIYLGPRGPGRPAEYVHLEKAIDGLEGLLKRFPGVPEYRQLLGRAYRNAGSRRRYYEERPKALEALEKGTRMLEDLVKEFPRVADYRYELAVSYAELERRSTGTSTETTAGESRLRRALESFEGLVAEYPDVPVYAVAEVETLARLAAAVEKAGKNDEALERLRSAVKKASALAGRFPAAAPYEDLLIRSRLDLGSFLKRQGSPAEARRLLQGIVDAHPGKGLAAGKDRQRIVYLQRTYEELGGLLAEGGEREAAKAAEETSRALKALTPALPRADKKAAEWPGKRAPDGRPPAPRPAGNP